MRTADDVEAVEWIPSGVSGLDSILGGGVPTRRISEVSGQFSVGKTTLCLMFVVQAQKEGRKTLWVDQEWSWEPDYAASLGVNNKKLDFIQEKHAEDALDAVVEYADKNKGALIVLDAVGALKSRVESEKTHEEKTIGVQANIVSRFMRKIVPILSLNNNALLLINHQVVDIMTGRIKTAGGAKLEFHRSIWLSLRKANKRIMQGENRIGDIIEAEVKKNKLAATMGKKTELELIYGKGFSKSADLIQEAIDKGVLVKQGQFFYLNGEKVARGMNALRELATDESFAAKLQ